MKEIIKSYYAIIFGITGGRTAAHRIAIFIVATLCVLSLSGILLLTREMMPVKQIGIAFTFPYSLATEVGMFLLLYVMYPASKVASKNLQKNTNYMLVLLPALIAVLLYGYTLFTKIA